MKPFTTIKLIDGKTLEMFEPNAGHFMRAQFQMLLHDSKYQVGMTAYIIKQIALHDK